MAEKIYRKNICPLCKKEGVFLFKTRDKFHNLPGIFHVFRWPDCLIEYVEAPKNLADFYVDNYFKDEVIENNSLFKLKKKIIKGTFRRKGMLRRRLNIFLSSFIAALPRQKGKIMDIGCGSGDILYLLKGAGFDVYGIDISQYAVGLAHKHGLNKVTCGMEDKLKDYQDDYFDCIRGSHVLEHMVDPMNFIALSHKKLKDGGVLLLQTPNTNSLGKLFGKHAKFYRDIPRHLILFSNKSLKLALAQAGFKKIKMEYRCAFSDFRDNLFYFLEDAGGASRFGLRKKLRDNLLTNFLFLPIDLIVGVFGKGQTLTVIAEK